MMGYAIEPPLDPRAATEVRETLCVGLQVGDDLVEL